jgi:predicted Rossmann-fold nucleotide-binding protein
LIDDKPAIAVLGPVNGEDSDGLVATLSSSLASSGYTLIVSGYGQTATIAERAARMQGGAVCIVTEVDDTPTDGLTEGRTIMLRSSRFQCTESILEFADALVVLPGDLQALASLVLVWSYGATEEGPYRPLVLLGEDWPRIVKSLANAAGLDRRQRAMVTFATAADEAVEALRYYIAP